MTESLPHFSYKLDRESGPARSRPGAGPRNDPTGYRHHMFVKALCILAVIFVGIGMVGIAIRRRRGL